MQHFGSIQSTFGIENHGIMNAGRVHWNLSESALLEEAIRRREGILSSHGALAVNTGEHTGRSPNDKFIVDEPSSRDKIDWGVVNVPFDSDKFDRLHARMLAYFQDRDLFVVDARAGAAPSHAIQIRLVTTRAWHALFGLTMFIRPDVLEGKNHVPEFTVLHAPGFLANPELDGTRSHAFVIVNYGKRLVLIGGTEYAGEIKKSVFSILNYVLPQRGVLPLHSSLNVGHAGDAVLFFGLSGTGKTTLSADPTRTLVGDDEHGWNDEGTFNFEGGCYAKAIKLSKEAEPDIWRACHAYATILENVVLDPDTRVADFDEDAVTENTRAAYRLSRIPNASDAGVAGHPRHIVMLTADAYGVLPPIARLTPDQAMYHFLSGYTAKVAGTESGVTKPQATFSACFGAPFLSLPPTTYANMLGEKIAKHGVHVWLVNTGWSGGAYGIGRRMSIAHTRAMLHAIIAGKLADARLERHPVFKIGVPAGVPGVPTELLTPRATWGDKDGYDRQAQYLADQFRKNFEKYAGKVRPAVTLAGPGQ